MDVDASASPGSKPRQPVAGPVGSQVPPRPAAARMALLICSRVAFNPQISWPPRSACSGVMSPLRSFATWSS